MDVPALQARYPDYGIVDAVEAPDGGIWALGADGGVFALEGAKFLGSYFTLDAVHRNDPSRQFLAIQRDDATGGYRLITNKPGQAYSFAGTAPKKETVAPPAAGATGATTVDANQKTLTGLLQGLNLGGLADQAWNYWLSMGATASTEAVNLWLREQPAFQQRFPALKDLEAKNIFWTPGQYLAYETEARSAMTKAGIPADFYDNEDIAELVRNDWSIDEVKGAVNQAANAVATMPAEQRQYMQEYYGVGAGDLTAFYLDPDQKGTSLIERKAMEAIAGIGGAVSKTSFGGLSLSEADQLNRAGVSGGQAAQSLGGLTGLLSETVGESMAGQDLGRGTALGAVTGTQADQEALEKRRASRQAVFAGGGGAGGGGNGKTGLGSA